jgi:hypothetical protein
MATSWFKYDGSGSTIDPTNYNEIPFQGNWPSPNVNICNIFAKVQFIGGSPRPIITPALQNEIKATALPFAIG